jgi:hypothetical protein
VTSVAFNLRSSASFTPHGACNVPHINATSDSLSRPQWKAVEFLKASLLHSNGYWLQLRQKFIYAPLQNAGTLLVTAHTIWCRYKMFGAFFFL